VKRVVKAIASKRRRPPSTLRQRQAEATRGLIVEAARTLFLEHGYGPTTIEAIAAAAGVAVSTVYFAFGSKRALLRALRERWHGASQIKQALEQARELADGAARLVRFAAATRRQWELAGDVVAIYRSAAAAEAEAAAELRAALAGRRAALDGFVGGLAAQLAPALRPERAAAILRALSRVEVYEELVQESGWAPEEYERWLGAALVRQLLGR
jgi:AcrR family transcriptional regulator